jgi:putative restriction endonuclease
LRKFYFQIRLLSGGITVHLAAQTVLNSAFPDTLHLDIIIAVGLDGEFALPATKRDARFREEVMRAYSYTCAVCGYDGRLGKNPIGLEAAHIRWAHFGGPNKVSNGLCMCALHHKIFDMGGITVDAANWQVVVSKDFNGLGIPARAIREFHGSKILVPPLPDEVPLAAHFDWHRRQVFRSSSSS